MKKTILWLALAGTLAAVYFAPREDDDARVAAPTRVAAAGGARDVAASSTERTTPTEAVNLKIRPRNGDDGLGNVFANHNWQPTAPAAAVAALVLPPPGKKGTKPTIEERGAPPLPFQFLGRYVDDGKISYFFQFAERNLVLHVGDLIDDTYKFDSSTRDTLTFIFLPLKQKQTMAVGDVN